MSERTLSISLANFIQQGWKSVPNELRLKQNAQKRTSAHTIRLSTVTSILQVFEAVLGPMSSTIVNCLEAKRRHLLTAHEGSKEKWVKSFTENEFRRFVGSTIFLTDERSPSAKDQGAVHTKLKTKLGKILIMGKNRYKVWIACILALTDNDVRLIQRCATAHFQTIWDASEIAMDETCTPHNKPSSHGAAQGLLFFFFIVFHLLLFLSNNDNKIIIIKE